MTDSNLMPTSVAVLRGIAQRRKRETEAAERHLEYIQDRQEDAEEELRRAEQGIAPPGFYLTDGGGNEARD
jgi:hypothetical protein